MAGRIVASPTTLDDSRLRCMLPFPHRSHLDTMTMLRPQELEHIAGHTLDHYNQHAQSFWRGTRDHDVRQNIDTLLRHIENDAPYTILDFGCGPGRDLKTFTDLGHLAIGVEGAARFVEMARAYSGCEVWQQDFMKLDLPSRRFDG